MTRSFTETLNYNEVYPSFEHDFVTRATAKKLCL